MMYWTVQVSSSLSLVFKHDNAMPPCPRDGRLAGLTARYGAHFTEKNTNSFNLNPDMFRKDYKKNHDLIIEINFQPD